MIAISLPPTQRSNWNTISFTSTLYLYPILDLLLAHIPSQWQAEVRLGLQEALVNAAKHGNNLDPSKTVIVRYSTIKENYFWIISDEGNGFVPECNCEVEQEELLPPDYAENGRGLCILHQVFDLVRWNRKGNQLSLCKQIAEQATQNPIVS
ncbi:MAG: anti-sigma regulatory factor [Prochloraceae cyanobacterium]|nr:anti-sigma regulatory factor [Prochloraceae cyanobacterium]